LNSNRRVRLQSAPQDLSLCRFRSENRTNTHRDMRLSRGLEHLDLHEDHRSILRLNDELP